MKRYFAFCLISLMALSLPVKSHAQFGAIFDALFGTMYGTMYGNHEHDSKETYIMEDNDYCRCQKTFPIETLYDDKTQNNLYNYLEYLYDSKNNTSRLILSPEYDSDDFSDNSLYEELDKRARNSKNKGYYIGNATVSFDDIEQFEAKFLYIADLETSLYGNIVIAVEHAFRGAVDEIGNGGWNSWSKLKYLNSRLAKKNIDFVLLNTEDDWFIGSINFKEPTADTFKEIFKRLGDAQNDHEFYKYSWE